MPFPWTKKKQFDPEKDEVESGMTFSEIMKEREDYVKNIGIEYRFGCYEEKRADSCQLLGEYFEAVDLNFAAAFETFRENCELRRFPRSCLKYGQYLVAGRECAASFKKAMDPLQLACDAGLGRSCKILGLIYWNSEPDRNPDPTKAEQLMVKACDLGEHEACWLLSTWYMGPTTKFYRDKKSGKATPLDRKIGSLDKNMEKSLSYGLKACDEGDVYQSCSNVSRMYRIGDGISKNPEKANEYAAKTKELHERLKKGWNAGFTG